MTNIHADEVLNEEDLPKNYTAFTPVSAPRRVPMERTPGGLIRQHQFNKVEMVKIVRPETSYEELELLLGNAEAILRELGIHYRVIMLCTGDTGFSSAKTYDIEVWLPGKTLTERSPHAAILRTSRPDAPIFAFAERARPKTELVHTLNGSGLAIGRTLVAVLENYQRADGTVLIPPVLRPYMGGAEEIAK